MLCESESKCSVRVSVVCESESKCSVRVNLSAL